MYEGFRGMSFNNVGWSGNELKNEERKELEGKVNLHCNEGQACLMGACVLLGRRFVNHSAALKVFASLLRAPLGWLFLGSLQHGPAYGAVSSDEILEAKNCKTARALEATRIHPRWCRQNDLLGPLQFKEIVTSTFFRLDRF